jgi:hypothetical protein
VTSPEIPDSASPFWLRLYGRWVHLNGIMPVVDVTPQRAFNDLITVDGYRYVQAAPRGPRTWQMDYRWGTAAATAALESAAYANNFSDPLTRTLLMDRNDARVNMVDPDLNTTWATSWADPYTAPQFIMNVGEGPENPIWLPSYDFGDFGVSPEVYARRAYFALLPGVTYTAAVWTVALSGFAGQPLLRVNDAETNTELGEYVIEGGGTNDSPELASVTFTAPDNVPAGETIELEMFFSFYNTGLMLYEGDCPPDYYRAGRRAPCQVSVQDPALTVNPIWSKRCNPCDLPREHATFTIQEVGVSAGADLVVS